MIRQYDIWTYIHGKRKRTDMVAKEFGVTTEQANHMLQKLENYGHATKVREGLYSFWTAVEDCPPRQHAWSKEEKDSRKEDVLQILLFHGASSKVYVADMLGLSPRLVYDVLRELKREGLVDVDSHKVWRAI